ncbi:rRNA pseudouridine synthase [Candidatus Woesearchaeota archaeon]|nr:rRNA pseudouridine synthase [Candidatus Woesearchaeota archaeon]
MNNMIQRVQKILAHAGIASRRNCEELIASGRVKVNGKSIKLGDKADPEKDRVSVDGIDIRLEKKIYILLNKPKGVVCSTTDKEGKQTVLDIVKCPERIYPVGRLDLNSEGLIILTNDGDFANSIIHPRYGVNKRYKVWLDKEFQDRDLEKLKGGVIVDDRKVHIFDAVKDGNKAELSIHEGRKHIVRKLFHELGYSVTFLKRTMIGNLALDFGPGAFRKVSKEFLEQAIFGKASDAGSNTGSNDGKGKAQQLPDKNPPSGKTQNPGRFKKESGKARV